MNKTESIELKMFKQAFSKKVKLPLIEFCLDILSKDFGSYTISTKISLN